MTPPGKLSVKTCEDLKPMTLEKLKKLLGEGKGETIYNQIRGMGEVELQAGFELMCYESLIGFISSKFSIK